LLHRLKVKTPQEIAPADLFIRMLIDLRATGRDADADGLELSANWYHKREKQWDASRLLSGLRLAFSDSPNSPHGLKTLPGRDKCIAVGITAADIYDGDSNYLFGTAFTNGRVVLTSIARFQASMWDEPPDRKRLVLRTHRQLLSGIGFSIGVPRPTDPTSARAYPNGIQQQDAKSEYMSEACISGFEKALGIKLPDAAHKPAGAR
jgi:predicted Zn-dependent protease